MDYKQKQLNTHIDMALLKLYNEDHDLIIRKVHERSIVFCFAIYFLEVLKETEFEKYNLDFEYNRNNLSLKSTRNWNKGSYPDLILHKRGNNNENILIVEFKPWWNKDQSKDILKIKDFISGDYKYRYGATILLGKEKPIFKWIK